jgi:hypothetical protein
MYFKNFFNGIHWYDLVPDKSHTFLTAGYGTFTSGGFVGNSDYATGARTQDGALGVVYTPVAHTLTIAMNSFGGPVTARWYDPTADTFRSISGSPFPNSGTHNFTTPGNNSAGDLDWVLLLQASQGSPKICVISTTPWISSRCPATLVRFASSRSRTPAVMLSNAIRGLSL